MWLKVGKTYHYKDVRHEYIIKMLSISEGSLADYSLEVLASDDEEFKDINLGVFSDLPGHFKEIKKEDVVQYSHLPFWHNNPPGALTDSVAGVINEQNR